MSRSGPAAVCDESREDPRNRDESRPSRDMSLVANRQSEPITDP